MASATRSTTPRKAAPVRSKRRNPVLPIVFGLIVALGIVAVVASRGSDDSGVPAGVEQTRTVDVTGTDLPKLTSTSADAAVGTPSPVVQGATFTGEPVEIGTPGTPQLVMFVAHWCPHCQREVPVVTRWLDEAGPPAGVELRAVATATSADRPNYPPSKWLDQEGWPVTTLADDGDGTVARAFGLSGFPFFVVLDGQGTVVARNSGELTIDEIEAMLATARGV